MAEVTQGNFSWSGNKNVLSLYCSLKMTLRKTKWGLKNLSLLHFLFARAVQGAVRAKRRI